MRHSWLVTGIPFYYGWLILIAGMIGTIMSSPGQTYSISIFIEHFIRDLGINRSTVSTLYMLGTLSASFTMPFVGRQIDERGPRVVVGVVTVLFALACVYMSLVQNVVMLGIGFLFIRMLGQGSMTIVSGNILNSRADTAITLSAAPAAAWQFAGWSGDLSGVASPTPVIMDSDKTITATFTELADCIPITNVMLTRLTTGNIYTDTNVPFSADLAPDNVTKPYIYTVDYGSGDSTPTTSSDDLLALSHTWTSVTSRRN